MRGGGKDSFGADAGNDASIEVVVLASEPNDEIVMADVGEGLGVASADPWRGIKFGAEAGNEVK